MFSSPAFATTFTVTKTADTSDGVCDADCSLREAIAAANTAGPGPHTIDVPPGTYTLTLGELQIGPGGSITVTINGTGNPSNTTIQQTNTGCPSNPTCNNRVFDLDPNLNGGVAVTIQNVTITGGRNNDTIGGAGVISGFQTPPDATVLSNCVITDNQVLGSATNAPGGGIQNIGGDLTITNCTLSNNSSGSSPGGAVYYDSHSPSMGALTVTGSTFSGNAVANSSTVFIGGGAIFASGASASTYGISASVFTSNTVTGSSTGPVGGGAIYFSTGTLTVTGSTFTGSQANGPAASTAGGGAINSGAGTAGISFCRIVGNSATNGPGGLLNNDSGPATTAATNNWWGCNAGPGNAGCDAVGGTVSFNPWIVLSNSASLGTILINQSTTLTASFLQNSASAAISVSDLGALIGLPVAWGNAVLGSLSGTQTSIQSSGTATATFTAGGTPGNGHADATVDNGTATANVTILGIPDLTVAKSHSGNFFRGQTGATYTITVSNGGNGATSGTVEAVDTLTSGLTATGLSGTGWTCVLGTLTCTRSDALAALGSYPTITLTVDVATNAPASVTNSVAVSGGGEVVTANDTASDPTTITAGPDLTIAKSHSGNFRQGDTGDTYTITVTNSGAAATVGTVTVTDTLPSGLTATGLSGTGWSCVLGTLTCTRSDVLATSSSYPAITLTVDVATSAPASVTNSAAVSGGADVNGANDTASDVTAVTQVPDLTIAKTHSAQFFQGQTGEHYTVIVSNGGSGPTSGAVSVTDTLPSGLTATAIGGTGWSCVLGTLTCTRSDALAANSSYAAITLTVDVAANAPASVTNSAAVLGGGELDTANDAASDLTSVSPPAADLAVTKSHSGSFVQGQTGATYLITVANVGSAPTSGTVTVTDTLPAELTATALVGTGWTCTLGTLTCTRSDTLAGAASYPGITLTVNVAAHAPGSLTNSASVSGGGDADAANNSSDDVTVVAAANGGAIPVASTAGLAVMAALLLLLGMGVLRGRG